MPVFHTSDYQLFSGPVSADIGLEIKDVKSPCTYAYKRYIEVDNRRGLSDENVLPIAH